MAILETEAVQLSNAVRDAMVALRTLVNGNQLTNNLLETTDKTDLVSAVNELKASIDALSYDDLADLPTIPATVAELTDANSYDFPTLNTPVLDALAAKANSADLGTIATFEGDQNLRTTDSVTFGTTTLNGYLYSNSGGVSLGANGLWQRSVGHLTLVKTGILGWSGGTNVNIDQPGDLRLTRIASGTLGVGTAAGTTAGTVQCANLTASGTVTAGAAGFKSYNSYTDASNYESFETFWSGNTCHLGTLKAGSGTARDLKIGVNGSYRIIISSSQVRISAHLEPESYSGIFDLGTASRPWGELHIQDIYASGTVKTGSLTVAVATASSSATAVAAGAGASVYITDETGGATLAVSDGTVWRRVSDRASIS